jgi:hypothetical protein
MHWFAFPVSIRSMHDRSVPLMKVGHAGGPGWSPFNMYHPCYSQTCITHAALADVVVSELCLGMVSSPICGDSSPIRAFQSPHVTDGAPYGMHPKMSSMKLRATSSSLPRFCIFCIGGMYTLLIQIFPPPWTCIHIFWAYSFPVYLTIFMPFFTIMAIPPLLPFYRRYSYT